MSSLSVSSSSAGDAETSKRSAWHDHDADCECCNVDIHIDSRGDVNIYNCAPSSGKPPPECPPCNPPYGTCIPVVAGAKHKLSREQKLNRLAEGVPVPSSLAAGVVHMMRRFMLGMTPANPLETAAFATLGKISRDLLSCTLTAFDAAPPRQRGRLFAPSLLLDPSQPLDEAALSTALGEEIAQRVGIQVFGDPNSMDEERPGRIRVYEPQPEDFYSQVRICKINDVRSADFVPPISPDNYQPAEIQHDCAIQIVEGQPEVTCQVRTAACPGHTIGSACARVLDIALGDSVVLEGVNYFSVDAKVRFSDKDTGAPVRDVDTHVWGDVATPVTDGQNLINDCRVHDRLTFQVPDDLAPKTYLISVVVPNITGISAFGTELVSNSEFLNLIPSATARFEIVTEWINAREETSPSWWGSDEVGLHTLAAAFDTNFERVSLPGLLDPNKRAFAQEEPFKNIQSVDFDSGTSLDITRKVFAPDTPILGMLLVVLGDEIDSQGAYDKEVTSTLDYFIDLVKSELPYISGGTGGAIEALIKAFSWTKVILLAVALALVAAIDLLVAWWAPADPIIRDSIALSINDLAILTSSNTPAPDPATFTSENGIVVNVNKTIPPVKKLLEYHETREYVCADQDSRYEITYRFSHVV
jgi:hypothetical protein